MTSEKIAPPSWGSEDCCGDAFVLSQSSLVVLTTKREAQVLACAECLKGSQIMVNRAIFFH